MAKTIRFDSKFRIIVQYSIRFEIKKTLFAQHYFRQSPALRSVQHYWQNTGVVQLQLNTDPEKTWGRMHNTVIN